MIQVGDYLEITAGGLGEIEAVAFVKIERETNTLWVCEGGKSVNKGDMMVRGSGALSRAKKVEGTAAALIFRISTETEAEQLAVISDSLRAFGQNTQADVLNDAIVRYRESKEPRNIPALKPKWGRIARYQRGAPRHLYYVHRYIVGDKTLGSVKVCYIGPTHEDHYGRTYFTDAQREENWRWEATYESAKLPTDGTLKDAKRAIVSKYRELNP